MYGMFNTEICIFTACEVVDAITLPQLISPADVGLRAVQRDSAINEFKIRASDYLNKPRIDSPLSVDGKPVRVEKVALKGEFDETLRIKYKVYGDEDVWLQYADEGADKIKVGIVMANVNTSNHHVAFFCKDYHK